MWEIGTREELVPFCPAKKAGILRRQRYDAERRIPFLNAADADRLSMVLD